MESKGGPEQKPGGEHNVGNICSDFFWWIFIRSDTDLDAGGFEGIRFGMGETPTAPDGEAVQTGTHPIPGSGYN